MTRREFLTGAAMVAAVPTGMARAQTPEAVRLHVFSKSLGWLGYDDLAETVAQAGYGGIDLTVRPKGHVEPERVEQDLPRAVEAARKQGLEVRMIVTAIQAADEPLAERTLKTAAQCGVQVYRMGYFAYDHKVSVEDTIERLRRQTAALAALNQRCGITGCYQNHYAWNDTLFGGAVWDVHAVLKGLDPQWIGCQYDVRHAVAESNGSWSIALRLIAPYIRSICLKDFVWTQKKGRWVPETVFGDEGTVPWERYLKLLNTLKLVVPASVHCEWTLFTPEESALPEGERRRIAVAKMKREGDFFKAQYAKAGLKAG
ncbi:MAG TPA: sugar phosphate isomerase/epimerase family protein [Kiritimatiellia bacterium]|nr:sugar phosphate isomerase/epimerase family protein [Kiritimatiellia bacterium]